MGLNIKNAGADRLARELAEIKGETLTAAIIAALRERVDRLKAARRREGLSKRLSTVGADCAGRLTAYALAKDPGEPLLLKGDDFAATAVLAA